MQTLGVDLSLTLFLKEQRKESRLQYSAIIKQFIQVLQYQFESLRKLQEVIYDKIMD